jgi:NADPH:quinone reductase-like Zn-dependent oxidoreductase
VRSVQVDRLSEGFDRVQLVDAPVAEPGPGQLRVRMRLSPVNPSDLSFVPAAVPEWWRRTEGAGRVAA